MPICISPLKKRFVVVVIFIFAGSRFLKIHLVHQREEFKIKAWNQRFYFKILCWFHFEFWNRVLWMIVQNNVNCRVPRILWCSARAVRTHFTREKYHRNFSRPTVKRDGVSRIRSRNNETHKTLCFFVCFFLQLSYRYEINGSFLFLYLIFLHIEQNTFWEDWFL